jgi:anti-sigma factor RsiW
MTPHLTEDDLLLHYYGETDPSSESTVAAHLGSCSECRAALVRLERLLAMVDSGVDVDVPATFERDTWRRLAPHVAGRKPTRSIFPRVVWGAAAAGVLLAVFLVAHVWPPTSRLEPQTSNFEPRTSPAVDAFRERILLADLEEHFERSEMMLVELVNTSHYTPAEIRREQAQAEDLLAANRLYRQTAADVGNARVAHVLEELERLLVDVAASSPTATATDLETLGRRTESQNLIFKVRVLSRSTGQGFDRPRT